VQSPGGSKTSRAEEERKVFCAASASVVRLKAENAPGETKGGKGLIESGIIGGGLPMASVFQDGGRKAVEARTKRKIGEREINHILRENTPQTRGGIFERKQPSTSKDNRRPTGGIKTAPTRGSCAGGKGNRYS